MIMTLTGLALAFLVNYVDDWDACLLILLALLYSEMSMSMSHYVTSDATEHLKSSYPSVGNSFSFKLKDNKGRVHRFNFGECVGLIWQPWFYFGLLYIFPIRVDFLLLLDPFNISSSSVF